jgi:hypothetical protein
VVIPGGAEHEARFREDTEVIDFFSAGSSGIGLELAKIFAAEGT